MKKKGQALVEFVIILPIFILLVLGVFDIGRILYSKINLESQMSDIVDIYKKDRSIDNIKRKLKMPKDCEIKILEDGDFTDIILVKKIDIITPGLQLIFDNPYSLKLSRSILNE